MPLSFMAYDSYFYVIVLIDKIPWIMEVMEFAGESFCGCITAIISLSLPFSCLCSLADGMILLNLLAGWMSLLPIICVTVFMCKCM